MTRLQVLLAMMFGTFMPFVFIGDNLLILLLAIMFVSGAAMALFAHWFFGVGATK